MISILGFPLRGLYTIVGISILGFPLRVLHGYHSRVRLKGVCGCRDWKLRKGLDFWGVGSAFFAMSRRGSARGLGVQGFRGLEV